MEQPGSKALRYRRSGSSARADRVLALLVPAVLESPRVARRLVHGVEVVPWQGDRRGQLRSTSCGRVKCATKPPGSTGPAPAPRSVSWLPKASMADRFLAVTWRRQRYLAGPPPGNPRVGWYRPVPHPDRIAQHGQARAPRGAARCLVIGVCIPVPRREAHLESSALLAQDGGQFTLAGGESGIGEPQPDHFGTSRAQHLRERQPSPRPAAARARPDRRPGATPPRR